KFRDALGETHGVIVYHEQVIRTVAAVTGYDLSEADRIRRHLSDELEVEEIHDDFVRRARDQGLDPGEAEKIWKEVSSFASFGFCKAHAAAFAVPTYQSAYLKAHYPAQFLAGVLTHEPGMYPRRLFLEEARLHGIPVLPLDVNESEEDYVAEPVEETYGIRLALKDVHGISADERRSILEARADRRFATVEDFNRRTRVSQPVLERIAHAGGFDRLRREPSTGSRRDRLFEAMAAEPSREGDQLTLAVHEPVETSLRDYNDAERVRAELEVLGVDGSRHLMTFFEGLMEDLHVVRSKDLWRERSDTWVMVAGVKVASQTPAVRSGQRIIFLTLDDATGPVDVTVFERAQARCAKTVFHSFVLA